MGETESQPDTVDWDPCLLRLLSSCLEITTLKMPVKCTLSNETGHREALGKDMRGHSVEPSPSLHHRSGSVHLVLEVPTL